MSSWYVLCLDFRQQVQTGLDSELEDIAKDSLCNRCCDTRSFVEPLSPRYASSMEEEVSDSGLCLIGYGFPPYEVTLSV
jgi:hypothetical protein